MAAIDPWLIIDLLMLAGGVLAIILSIWWLLWLDIKYGPCNPPEEVQRIWKGIKKGPVEVDLTPFVFDRELNDRRTYKRPYDTPEGHWVLTLEFEGPTLVAFQTVFKHNKSWLMDSVIEDWSKYPKIIQISGCG